MTSMQTTSTATTTTRSARGPSGAALLLPAIVIAVAGFGLILVRGAGAPVTTMQDPLTGPAAIEFRAGERAGAVTTMQDPLTGPAAIEFRAGERAEASR